MSARSISLAVACGLPLVVAAAAFAQTPGPLTNASFENSNLFNPVEPEGWHNVSNPFGARHRSNTDGLLPTVTARTGVRCIELAPIINQGGNPSASQGGFIGFTTDTTNFFDPNFSFYDPFFDYNDQRGVHISGWYMIPADAPIVGDAASIKIDIKTGNQNVATFEHFAPDGTDPLAIQGHTGGEWRLYNLYISRAEIEARYQENIAPNGCSCVPDNPRPNHIKITPSRFGPIGTVTSGVIFWDDLAYERADQPVNTCAPDFNGDGNLDPDDLADYIGAFFSEPPGAGSDFNGDSLTDPDDLADYIGAFFAGCP